MSEKIFDIPKIVWTYWDDDIDERIPPSINKIIRNNKTKFEENNWQFKVLNKNSINNYINLDNLDFQFDSISRKADFIRLSLLNQYGGLWLDSSIIVNDISEIEKIYEQSISNKVDLAAFYLKGCQLDNDPRSYIENWFLLSPPQNQLINNWKQEFIKALKLGPSFYYEVYSYSSIAKISPCINQYGNYLLMHLSLQILFLHSLEQSNILLFPADDSMFKIHIECDWNTDCIQNRLLNDLTILKLPFIKLRAPDRPWDLTQFI